MKRILTCLLCGILLTACAEKDKNIPPMSERISLSAAQTTSLSQSKAKIFLGKTKNVLSWNQTGQNAAHQIPYSNGGEHFRLLWDKDIGDDISDDAFVIPEPIVHNGIIYALDANFALNAVRLYDGKILWNTELPFHQDVSVKSVGLAFDNDTIYTVSGEGIVYAVDTDGKIKWERDLETALRSAPVIYDGTIFLLSASNKIFALNTLNGNEKWVYQTTTNQTNLLGMGSPAVRNDVLVVGFSTGEVMAFNALTGTPIWTQNVLSNRMYNKILDLTHILASPVIADDVVYVIGNARKVAAFDLQTGEPVFDATISGHHTPALTGNALYLIADNNKLLALNKNTGALFFETPLIEKTKDIARWYGPVLMNGYAFVVSEHGTVLRVDLTTGKAEPFIETDETNLTPIIVENKLIFLSNQARLFVYGE